MTIFPPERPHDALRFQLVTEMLRRLLEDDQRLGLNAGAFFDWLASDAIEFPANDAVAANVNGLLVVEVRKHNRARLRSERDQFEVTPASVANVKEAKMWLFTAMAAPNVEGTIRVRTGDDNVRVNLGGNSHNYWLALKQWYGLYR